MNSVPIKSIKNLFRLLAVASWCCGAAQAASAVTNAPVIEWTFEHTDDFQGWKPNGDLTNNKVANGVLSGLGIGGDPFWVGPAFQALATNFPYVVVRMKLQSSNGTAVNNQGDAQLFWYTSSAPGGSESTTLRFETIGDGQWHDYTIAVSENSLWENNIKALRFDPCWGGTNIQIAIDFIRLQTLPGKDYIAAFRGKSYEALVKDNLDVMIYPTDKDAHAGKPIMVSNRFNAAPRNQDPQGMLRFVASAPPTLQSHKMIIHAQSDKGVPLTQTWKFSDNAITVEGQIKKYPSNEPSQWVCTFIKRGWLIDSSNPNSLWF